MRTVVKLEPDFPQGSVGTAPAAPAGSEPFPAPEFLEAAEAAALAGLMQPLIDALPEQIALLDNQGAIIAANRAWRKIVQEHGHEEASLGRNYRDFCVISAATGYQPPSRQSRRSTTSPRAGENSGSWSIMAASAGAITTSGSASTILSATTARSSSSPAST